MPHTDSIELVGSIVVARMAGIGAELPMAPRSMFDWICPFADLRIRD